MLIHDFLDFFGRWWSFEGIHFLEEILQCTSRLQQVNQFSFIGKL